MKIVITGANGYIGTVVTKHLDDYHLSLVDKDRFNLVNRHDKITSEIAYVHDLEADILIHLAAETSVVQSYSDAEHYYQNNCSQFHSFLNTNGNKFKRVIYASSFSVYDENFNISPGSVYASTKLEGENIVKRWASEDPSRSFSILRFANPVGVNPNDHGHLTSRMMSAYANVMWILARCKVEKTTFQLHDLPDMKRDIYPVQWIADAIGWIVENEDVGTVNLGSGFLTDIKTFATRICKNFSIPLNTVAPPPGTMPGPQSLPKVFKKHLEPYATADFDPIEYCIDQMNNYVYLIRNLKSYK